MNMKKIVVAWTKVMKIITTRTYMYIYFILMYTNGNNYLLRCNKGVDQVQLFLLTRTSKAKKKMDFNSDCN